MIATFVDSKTFLVSGDRREEFETGRRVRCSCLGSYKYGTVLSSSLDSVETEVVLTTASDDLVSDTTSIIDEVLYGIIGVGTNDSLPVHPHDGAEGSGGVVDGIDVIFTPDSFSNLVSTDVQSAIDELDDLDNGKMVRIVSVDNEIVRFNGVLGNVQGYTSNAPTITDDGLATFSGGLRGIDPISDDDIGDRGYNDIRYARVVKNSQTNVPDSTGLITFTLPAGYLITAIVFNSDGAVLGGIDVGTTNGGDDIVIAHSVAGAGRSLCTFVAGSNYNTTGADDTIYVTAENDSTSWGATLVDMTVLMIEVE